MKCSAPSVPAFLECIPPHKISCNRRVFKKAVQQGRNEREPEAYSRSYVEGLSEARTQLAAFFNTLFKKRL